MHSMNIGLSGLVFSSWCVDTGSGTGHDGVTGAGLHGWIGWIATHVEMGQAEHPERVTAQ